VIRDNVEECPECGHGHIDNIANERPGDRFELPNGKWACHYCRGVFDVWDYLDVDNRENADFPIFRESIKYTWEAKDKRQKPTETETEQWGSHRIQDRW
jgi:hypothetical protein